MSQIETFDTEPVIKIENVSLQYYVPREQIKSFKEFIIRKAQGQRRCGKAMEGQPNSFCSSLSE